MRTFRTTRGFTLIEVLLVVAIMGILMAIAVPALHRARISGNESSAIASLRAITSAQTGYHQFCNGYATALTSLAYSPATVGRPFLSADLTSAATAVKSGYTIEVVSGDGSGPVPNLSTGCPAASGTAYYATASALQFGMSGSRVFATNGSGTIWQNSVNVLPSEPFAVGGTIRPLQ